MKTKQIVCTILVVLLVAGLAGGMVALGFKTDGFKNWNFGKDDNLLEKAVDLEITTDEPKFIELKGLGLEEGSEYTVTYVHNDVEKEVILTAYNSVDALGAEEADGTLVLQETKGQEFSYYINDDLFFMIADNVSLDENLEFVFTEDSAVVCAMWDGEAACEDTLTIKSIVKVVAEAEAETEAKV